MNPMASYLSLIPLTLKGYKKLQKHLLKLLPTKKFRYLFQSKTCSKDKVKFSMKGKPFLMLCNKSDKSNSKDETQIAKALQVEKLVNVSKCPTRIEPCIANKNKVCSKIQLFFF